MTEYKLIIVGSPGIGKTDCARALVLSSFTVESYDPAMEWSYRKQFNIDGEASILDVTHVTQHIKATSLGYNASEEDLYRAPVGFVFCYAINDRNSFNDIQSVYYPRILSIKLIDSVPMVLIGNKCDLEQKRQVTTAEGEELARRFNAPFFETSAKHRINIEEVFFSLVREVRKSNSRIEVDYGDKKAMESKSKCMLM